ncbi:MAG: glycosyltransferase family 39 protein [Candidatus Omnitrophica bacterium]|nr:glycosyltransferase family 39 protein [Candidatus Omnitrophota bacterium]
MHPTEYFTVESSLIYLHSGSYVPVNYQHPTLFQYAVSAVAGIFSGSSDKYQAVYLIARILSALASFFSVVAIFFLSRHIFRSRVCALIAASFFGCNLICVKYAHYAVPDSFCLLFVVLSLVYALRVADNGNLRDYVLSGLFCGLSIGSKWAGLIALGFLICAHGVSPRIGRKHYRFLIGFIAACAVFVCTSPFHIVNWKSAAAEFVRYLSEKGYTSSGTFLTRGFFSYSFKLLPDVFGYCGFALALTGGILFLKKHKKEALVISIPSGIYFFIISFEQGGTLQNVLPLIPWFCVSAAFMADFLWQKKSFRYAGLLLVGVCVGQFFIQGLLFDSFLMKKDTRVIALEWLRSNVPEKSRIAFDPYTPYDLNRLQKSPVAERFQAEYFIPSVAMYSAAFYKENHFDYVVTSSFRQDNYRFFCGNVRACFPLQNYASIQTELRLVARFAPPFLFSWSGFSSPWGTWPHNPVISIYRVS